MALLIPDLPILYSVVEISTELTQHNRYFARKEKKKSNEVVLIFYQ